MAIATLQEPPKKTQAYEPHIVGERLTISKPMVVKLIKSGQLKASKVGRKYVCTDQQIEDFLKKNETKFGSTK